MVTEPQDQQDPPSGDRGLSDDAGGAAGGPPIEPGIADGVEHGLDPNAVLVARMVACVTVGAIALPLLVVFVVLAVLSSIPGDLKLALLLGWLVVTPAMIVWASLWPPVRHRYIRYRLDTRGFMIRRGVISRAVTSIPKARVQHTDVSQGPLQRRYGLATLVVHTAGTQDSSVSLGGLPHARATAIRDFLVDAGAAAGE